MGGEGTGRGRYVAGRSGSAQIFESIDDPQWDDEGVATTPLCVRSGRYEAMKKITHPGEKLV